MMSDMASALMEFYIIGRLSQRKTHLGAPLVAQWLRIRLPMQTTRVRCLMGKIPHAAEQLSPYTTTTEPAL